MKSIKHLFKCQELGKSVDLVDNTRALLNSRDSKSVIHNSTDSATTNLKEGFREDLKCEVYYLT